MILNTTYCDSLYSLWNFPNIFSHFLERFNICNSVLELSMPFTSGVPVILLSRSLLLFIFSFQLREKFFEESARSSTQFLLRNLISVVFTKCAVNKKQNNKKGIDNVKHTYVYVCRFVSPRQFKLF